MPGTQYLPSRSLILLAVENGEPSFEEGTLATWFEHTYKRAGYLRQRERKRAIKMTLRRGHVKGAENVWVIFDQVNGHSMTWRYLWVFVDKKKAEDHRAKELTKGTQFSEPERYHRTA